jgi:hypothetical protein
VQLASYSKPYNNDRLARKDVQEPLRVYARGKHLKKRSLLTFYRAWERENVSLWNQKIISEASI